MSDSSQPASTVPAAPADQPTSLGRDAWRRLKHNRLATVSLGLVAFIVASVILVFFGIGYLLGRLFL